jgi:Right handed beta helix region
MTTHQHHTVTPSPWRRMFCSLFLVAAVVAAVGAVASPRANQGSIRLSNALPADIIVVTNTNDSGPGSLRDALAIANDGDTIDATGVSGTILLTSGELQITHNVTINGPGAVNLAVNGNTASRMFENFASDVTISGLTITNGLPPIADNNGGGGILNHGELTLSDSIVSNSVAFSNSSGGGIFCDAGGTLTITNSQISSNSAGNLVDGVGGGICGADGATVTVTHSMINDNGAGCAGGGIAIANGQLTVINSTISGNGIGGPCQGGPGGGIAFFGNGTLTVTNSTISNNGAGGTPNGSGAGMWLAGEGTATISNSTISDNSTDSGGGGGGIVNSLRMLTVTNSTISGNSTAGSGGGIDNEGTLTTANTTFSGNAAFSGGAIYNGATVEIRDTVLNAGKFGGTILSNGGTVTSLGYNLASDDAGGVLTGPGDQINTDPMLGALQDNGGPTFTHELLSGSPAINAGDPSFSPPPFFDQRGPNFYRVRDGRSDIGSFEVQAGSTPTPTPRPLPTPRPRSTPRPRP